jgi:hypothetical protein
MVIHFSQESWHYLIFWKYNNKDLMIKYQEFLYNNFIASIIKREII